MRKIMNKVKEGQLKMDMINNDDDSKIIKDTIIGFLVVKYKRKDGSSYISTEPLIGGWDLLGDDEITFDSEKDEIIGILPAPPRSYKVLGLFPCREEEYPYPNSGMYELLGYEFSGAYFPSWKDLLEDEIKLLKERREKEEKLKKGDLSAIT